MSLLILRDLEVHYRTYTGMLRAVDGISLDLDRGEILGLVGESGCGKSTVAKSIMRLLPSDSIIKGNISFNCDNLVDKNEHEMTRIQGKNGVWSCLGSIETKGVPYICTRVTECLSSYRKPEE